MGENAAQILSVARTFLHLCFITYENLELRENSGKGERTFLYKGITIILTLHFIQNKVGYFIALQSFKIMIEIRSKSRN